MEKKIYDLEKEEISRIVKEFNQKGYGQKF